MGPGASGAGVDGERFDFYRAQSAVTDPGEHADVFAALPRDLPGLARAAGGLIVHRARCARSLGTGPDGPLVHLDDGLALTVPVTGLADGAAVLCLVRPEAVQRATAEARGPNRMGAAVTSAIYLGGRWECELALGSRLTLRAEMSAPGGGAPSPGERVTIVIAPEDIVVLSAGGEASRVDPAGGRP